MKVLITGYTGFIAQYFYKELSKKNIVYSLTSKKLLASNKENIIYLSLTKKNELTKFISSSKFKKLFKPDVIIHLSALTMDENNLTNFQIFEKNNLITKNIIKLSQELKPKLFINFSSISVYPEISGKYNETSFLQPEINKDCLYGLSKYNSEVLMSYFFKIFKINLLNLRVSQVLSDNMNKKRIIPTMVKEINLTNTITIFGDGKRESNFIYIHNLYDVIILLIKKKITGLYNIGHFNFSYLNLAKKIKQKYGDSKTKIIILKKGNKNKFNLDIKKLKDIIKKNEK